MPVRGVRLRELPLSQRPARSLRQPQRQLVRGLRQAGDLGQLRRRGERALRQAQRRGRAHLRGASEPRRRGCLVVQARRPVRRLALGEGPRRAPRTSWSSRWAARSTRSGTASCSGTEAARGAAAGASGGTRARRGSSPRSARVKPKNHTLEAFYLDRDEVPESETGSRLWGANYELAVGESSTFGATYMKVHADPDLQPERDGLNVYSARAFTAPFRRLPDLSFELEYAREDNGARSLRRLDGAGGVRDEPGGLEAQALLPLCVLRGRRPGDGGERGLRPAVPGLLRLGHVVAGRDRRGVLPVQLQPRLAPGPPAPDAQRVVGSRRSSPTLPRSTSRARSRPASPRRTSPSSSTRTPTGRSTGTSRRASLRRTPTRKPPWSRPSTGRRTSPTGWSTSPTRTDPFVGRIYKRASVPRTGRRVAVQTRPQRGSNARHDSCSPAGRQEVPHAGNLSVPGYDTRRVGA